MLLENTSIGLDEAVLLDALQKKKPLSAEAIKLLKRDGLVVCQNSKWSLKK